MTGGSKKAKLLVKLFNIEYFQCLPFQTIRLPLTFKAAEWVTEPAPLVALHVYSPMWV